MTTGTEFTRTDARGSLPRWLTLLLASAATVIAIGALWALAPSTTCGGGVGTHSMDGILPGPQPCTDGGTVPALVTAGILLAMLAAVFVVAFTVRTHRGRVLLILGGIMLLVLTVGLMATVAAANFQPPVIYY